MFHECKAIPVQPADARTHVDATRTRVLVIDDDPTTLELVRSVLEANEYACLTASSGEEALALIRATPGILIAISDISMPGMDGIALLRSLSAQPTAHAPPRVIFLTAYPRVDFAVAALRLGAVDFLTKPVRPQSLLRAVRSVVERIQREREMAQLSDRAALAQQAEALAAALHGWAQSQIRRSAPAPADLRYAAPIRARIQTPRMRASSRCSAWIICAGCVGSFRHSASSMMSRGICSESCCERSETARDCRSRPSAYRWNRSHRPRPCAERRSS